MSSQNESIMEFACKFAEEINAKAILLYSEVAQDLFVQQDAKTCFDTILITRGSDSLPHKTELFQNVINIPNVNVTRLGQIKIVITKGLATGLFKKGDKLICLTGVPKFGYIDSIFVIDVGREFEILTSENVSDIFENIYPEVFETVLNIALELAAQGREGRPIGTIFVLGDEEKVLELSRQMIINPFMGYREEEKNILDRNLRDTIKEFSALDGAFVVRGDGVLVTAGRHLSAALEGKDFPQGLGSRHIAAAGITSVTSAIAIAISESTGTVRIFKKGKIFVDIEKSMESHL
ncbi:MAG: DNA integrity scanning protein DisA nucleotide-binding domain protein [Deltaproteobacteria bacterium]|nr:DNA integrity scanning protein DisA nucleotide-binding domain protein [Deltaproteobacteria bacterium]